MIRPWHAIRPLRREVIRSRLHVPNVENERIRIFLLNHRAPFSVSSFSSSPTPGTENTKAQTDASTATVNSATPVVENPPKVRPKHDTVAEADAELLAKLEGISGEGGAAGVEYEGGKAVGLKRGVRDNMFRVI